MSLFIITVLSHTPPWVWAILAALVLLGLLQVCDQVVSPRRVLLQPIALGLLSLWSAGSAFGPHLGVLAPWLVGAAIGLALNRWLLLPKRVQALPGGRFAIGGSWAPLVLLMAIFVLRYIGAASLAVVPQLADLPAFAAGASLLYGLPVGLLAARAMRVLARARLAPAAAAA